MKGLIYREFYLSRKPILMMLLAYVIFVGMLSLVIISTYAGNLAQDPEAPLMRDSFYSQMYIYAGFIALIGVTYGHNDIIEKDYKSRWQLYSYTLPVNEKKIIASKFIVRGGLLLTGFLLAVLAEIIFAAAAKRSASPEHFKNILLMLMLYGLVCVGDIPFMLRMKSQAKAAAVGIAIFTPVMAALIYGTYKFIKYCVAEGKRLYPDMDSELAVKKVAMPYITKCCDIAMWIAPFFLVAVVVLCYFWAVKELKRRRY